MNRFSSLLAFPSLCAAAGALVFVACGNGDASLANNDGGVSEGGADATLDGPNDGAIGAHDGALLDAGGDADAALVDANIGVAYVRFANLSATAPALDVCVAAGGGFAQAKPIFGGKIAGGLGFAKVATYQPFTAGSYAVRFVAAGATDCNTPVDNATLPGVTLANDQYATIFAHGGLADAGAPLTAVALTDDGPYAAHVDAGNAYSAIRFVNASGAGTVDVGRGSISTSDFAPLFPGIAEGGVAAPNAQSGIDAHGYMNPLELQGDSLSAHVTGGAADLATWPNVAFDIGEVVTVFLVPGGPAVDGGAPNDAGADASDAGPAAPAAIRALACARDFSAPPNQYLNKTCAFLP